ncbi:MAG: transglycosylase SLT domain-containing protein [Candidatus Zixiibacteriota bacterium]
MDIKATTYNVEATASKPKFLETKPDLEMEKKRLFKVAKDMESLFLYQVLKAMRDAIPKGDEEDQFGLSGGFGEDVYTQMFDQELAAKMAGVSDRSIAATIYRSLEKSVERQFEKTEDSQTTKAAVISQPKYIKVKQEDSAAEQPVKVKSVDRTEKKAIKTDYDPIINKVSQKYKLNPDLIKSVVMTESGGDATAVSPAGAKGLMQLTDTTAADMGVRDVFDPTDNIEGGTKYLRKLIDRFGDIEKALAAYNAGPARVEKYGGIPPYTETQQYVKTVIDTLGSKQIFYE